MFKLFEFPLPKQPFNIPLSHKEHEMCFFLQKGENYYIKVDFTFQISGT
jgi:hypothetical protein